MSTLHMSGQKLEKKMAETQYWSWNPEADGPSGYSSVIATLVVYIDL